MSDRPKLVQEIEARLVEPVEAGSLALDDGQTLTWDADGIRLGADLLPSLSAQLSLEPVAQRWWSRLLERRTLHVELRARTHRLRLQAQASASRVEGLPELAMGGATPVPLGALVALLHAVRVHDGTLLIADAAAGRVELPVPEAAPHDEPPPPPRPAQDGPPPPTRLRAALTAWRLWLSGLPLLLLPMATRTVRDGELGPLPVPLVLLCAFLVLPWVFGGLGVALRSLRRGAPLDHRRAGYWAGFGVALTLLSIGYFNVVFSVEARIADDGPAAMTATIFSTYACAWLAHRLDVFASERLASDLTFVPLLPFLFLPAPHVIAFGPAAISWFARRGEELAEPVALLAEQPELARRSS